MDRSSRSLFVGWTFLFVTALTCYAPPMGIWIYTTPTSMPNSVTTVGIDGGEYGTDGTMWWSNELNSAHGSQPVSGPWSVSGIALGVGNNPITVTAQDSGGTPFSDQVTINRRTTPLTYYVATNGGNVYPYTNWAAAAQAVQSAAGAAAGGDTVLISNGTYLLTSEIAVTTGLTFQSVNGPGVTTLDGQNTCRVFNVDDGVSSLSDVSISGLTLTHGNNGAVLNQEALLMECCAVTGSTNGEGGGIHNNGRLLLSRSTLSGNHGTQWGGGLCNGSGKTATVENCTFSGNLAGSGDYGGGLVNMGGPLFLQSCTIVSNHSEAAGGGMSLFGLGPVTIENTIVAGNTVGGSDPDVNGTVVSGGYNLIGDAGYSTGWTNTDLVGTSTAPAVAMTGPLTDNGGPTLTHALLAGSPAIDGGDPAAAPSEHDQRGAPYCRVLDGDADGTNTLDIGAFEYVNSSSDSDGDSMNDQWEIDYGLNATNPADATIDLDGDLADNASECIADTCPTNPGSVFQIMDANHTNSHTVVFSCTNSRVYSLQYATNLVNGEWLMVDGATNVSGVGGSMSLTDSVDAARRSYRVGVSLP